MQTIQFGAQTIHPSKIICVGRNYTAHIHELGNEVPKNMVLFFKHNACISTQLTAFHQEPLHYETELCFIYAQGRLAGVGLGLDLTKRKLQSQLKAKGLPWSRAKAFHGSALFSPFVAIDTVSPALHFQLHINDHITQQGHSANMLYTPHDILAEIQTFTTVEEGDIIMTGTPQGVGEIQAGDTFRVTLFDGEAELLTHQWRAI